MWHRSPTMGGMGYYGIQKMNPHGLPAKYFHRGRLTKMF